MPLFGVEGIRNYDKYRAANATFVDGQTVGPPIPYGVGGWVDLAYIINITNGFHDTMVDAGETARFYWRGQDVWEIDIKDAAAGGDDRSWADGVALWFFAGHSYIDMPDGSGAAIVFNSEKNRWSSSSRDWRLGGAWAADWIALYTCELLKFRHNTWANYINIFDGLHVVLGSWGHPRIGPDNAHVGRAFAENIIDGFPVSAAWFQALGADNAPAALSAEGPETWHSGAPDFGASTLSNDHYYLKGETRPDRPAGSIYWLHCRWVES